jgi:hypothetical protein
MIIPFHVLNEIFMFEQFGLKLTPRFNAEYVTMPNKALGIVINGEQFDLAAVRYAMMTKQPVRSNSPVDLINFKHVLEAKLTLPPSLERRINWSC